MLRRRRTKLDGQRPARQAERFVSWGVSRARNCRWQQLEMHLLKAYSASNDCFLTCYALDVRPQIRREVTTESRTPASPSAAPILLFWGLGISGHAPAVTAGCESGKWHVQPLSAGLSLGLPSTSERQFSMKTPLTNPGDLQRALARYIAQRPRQADSLVHLPSFFHCFADTFAGTSEQELREVFDAFVRDGWLTADPAGYRITPEGSQWARSGHLPPIQRA